MLSAMADVYTCEPDHVRRGFEFVDVELTWRADQLQGLDDDRAGVKQVKDGGDSVTECRARVSERLLDQRVSDALRASS